MSGITASRGYGGQHQAMRTRLTPLVLAGRVACARCGMPILPGEPWDLGHDDHDRTKYSGPEHMRCNRATGARIRDPVEAELEPERAGLAASDRRWRVPWLKGLRRPPRDATWPRLMTVPHPAAVGSLGPVFIEWAEARSGRPLRWWQRLVATRLLEHDADGRLVWETLVLSMARQLGKSWLLRELCLWRMHQGDRFGESQDVLHTGKDLAVCKEVQRPALFWAKARRDVYKVKEVNGQEAIELLADKSRWMLRAREATYGYAVSLAAIDEAWKVPPKTVDEGIVPTMVEREQPQLLLISTAHRAATTLMLRRRQAALVELEAGTGDLLIEWSAPEGAELDDLTGWQLASPHWTPQRQRTIQKELEGMRAGEIADPDEPDPVESFRAQWLNQWPRRLIQPDGTSEPLLPDGVWAELVEPGISSTGPVWVAVEDNWGRGASVAATARLSDGRLEVDGWNFDDWDTAITYVQALSGRRIRMLQVGASIHDRVPVLLAAKPVGQRETRTGLAILRDLAINGGLVHDELTFALDDAISGSRVKESATGLALLPHKGMPLVKALVWAVQAAHKPSRVPAIY